MKCCHACGHEWSAAHSPGRQEACPHCGADMHCCRNCRFYAADKAGECALSNTDPPRDKQRWNDCEEFMLLDLNQPVAAAPRQSQQKEQLKQKWDSLFKD